MAKEKGFISTALAVVLGVAGGYAVIKHWEPIKEFAVNAYAEISTSIKDWLDKDTTTPDTDLDINGGTNEDTDIDTPVSTKIQISLTDEQVARIDALEEFYMVDGNEISTWGEYCDCVNNEYGYSMYNSQGHFQVRWKLGSIGNWDEVPYGVVAYKVYLSIDNIEYKIECTRSGTANFDYTFTPETLESFSLFLGDNGQVYMQITLPGVFHTFSVDSVINWNNEIVYENA